LKHANLKSLAGGSFTFIEADLNKVSMESLFGGVGFDSIFHLAGQPGVRQSWGTDFAENTRANVDATQRLLEATLSRGTVASFVYASSSSVYGQTETFPTTELTLPRPFSPYGVTKLAGEHLCVLYRENYGLPTTAFRFFSVYGPRQRPDMAFSRFLCAAHAGSEITIYGDGTQVRDFTYVDDVVAALLLAARHGGSLPKVMNLSGGSSASVNEVLETVAEIAGRSLNIVYRPAVRGDVFRTGGDSSVATQALGWRPRMSLAQGLRRQYEWVRSSYLAPGELAGHDNAHGRLRQSPSGAVLSADAIVAGPL
jgi:nucleoside-diphosphate-sugar epimerase